MCDHYLSGGSNVNLYDQLCFFVDDGVKKISIRQMVLDFGNFVPGTNVTGGGTCKLHAERPQSGVNPAAFLIRGDHANQPLHCAKHV